jgi:oligoendopeptidase F
MATRRKIKINPANKGKLRKAAGVKKGQKVSAAKLRKLKNSKNPTTRKRAVFAENARKWAKKRKR